MISTAVVFDFPFLVGRVADEAYLLVIPKWMHSGEQFQTVSALGARLSFRQVI